MKANLTFAITHVKLYKVKTDLCANLTKHCRSSDLGEWQIKVANGDSNWLSWMQAKLETWQPSKSQPFCIKVWNSKSRKKKLICRHTGSLELRLARGVNTATGAAWCKPEVPQHFPEASLGNAPFSSELSFWQAFTLLSSPFKPRSC